MSLRILTTFYQRFGAYYSSEGWTTTDSSSSSADAKPKAELSSVAATTSFVRTATVGVTSASEEEKNATAELFSLIFNNLSGRRYDADLYVYALPCLTAIGCALPPDYSSPHWKSEAEEKQGEMDREWHFRSQYVCTVHIFLIDNIVEKLVLAMKNGIYLL